MPANQLAPVSVGMVLFPKFTQLDLTGPFEVFGRMPNATVYLLAANLDPVQSDLGLMILPNMSFGLAPQVDILFVPGGPGVSSMIEDEEILSFLSKQSARAKYITSVCTGSLVLAAAGLLQGRRATTHWLSMDLLERLGVQAVAERVVIDGNRVTGGGVTAGIDFALVIASMLCGEEVAQEIQLTIEYDPRPPFDSGSPKTASVAVVERVMNARKGIQEKRRKQIEQIASRLQVK